MLLFYAIGIGKQFILISFNLANLHIFFYNRNDTLISSKKKNDTLMLILLKRNDANIEQCFAYEIKSYLIETLH